MFTLLRLGFWFGLLMLALPLGVGSGDGEDASTVSPLQAITAAGQAVGDIAGLCQRQPEVCETGREALSTITVRARETARIAYRMMEDDQTEGPDFETATGSVGAADAPPADLPLASSSHNAVSPEASVPVPSAAPRRN